MANPMNRRGRREDAESAEDNKEKGKKCDFLSLSPRPLRSLRPLRLDPIQPVR